MNTAPLKSYAPQARTAFIAAVTAQANRVGVTEGGTLPATVQGDVMVVGSHAFPARLARARDELSRQVQRQGFAATMEAAAYTWFNRFAAMRYMEVHRFLDHGYRVLSGADGSASRPEILDHAHELDLPGLDTAHVIDLKLAGDQDAELYRLLLLAQCDALHRAMPFLFDPIGSATELLMPANLLHTDSLTRQMVGALPDALWEDIEIIGWLYQFYISDKKDEVIGTRVAPEDIPAATQLFTPNWIVKYMLHNSLGAKWLSTYPQSALKQSLDYYIEPEPQSAAVKAQLSAVSPDSLNPEELTLLDPACGSGHILVEGYELFKAMYLERGYRLRDIPKLVLEKNLFGLDIDQRAVQLTQFALMMKGRADDRRLFDRRAFTNVHVFQDSAELNIEALNRSFKLEEYGISTADLNSLKSLFSNATTVGSLVKVPETLAGMIGQLDRLANADKADLFARKAQQSLAALLPQMSLLSRAYSTVVANPPYMGSKYQSDAIRKMLQQHYAPYKTDLFSAFMVRTISLAENGGMVGLMTPFVWMFLGRHQQLRAHLVENHLISSLVQLEYSGFEGATVPICTLTIQKATIRDHAGTYIRLSDFRGASNQAPKTLEAIQNPNCTWRYRSKSDGFAAIPGSPFAYWLDPQITQIFSTSGSLSESCTAGFGIKTGNNELFMRHWHEVSFGRIDMDGGRSTHFQTKWYPCASGGEFRRWYGNRSLVVNYQNEGAAIEQHANEHGNSFGFNGQRNYFTQSVTWPKLTSSSNSFRFTPADSVFDGVGLSAFFDTDDDLFGTLAALNTLPFQTMIDAVAPTLSLTSGDLLKLPNVKRFVRSEASTNARELVGLFRRDWDSFERSWDFSGCPIVPMPLRSTGTIQQSYETWCRRNEADVSKALHLEESNNALLARFYGLAARGSTAPPVAQISLTVNPAYRYRASRQPSLLEASFLADTMEELVSYAIGCMMGRYSLDVPGLIYAQSGNEDFDPSQYTTFPADDDGIVPLTDTEWFEDDACTRMVEFLSKAWPAEHLEANLTFLANNLGPKKNESSRETLRRWLNTKFFKDHHLKRYKKRPIYWLFTSGRGKAFQCLVYLHRYNEGTLARMRAEYVIPLQGKMASRIRQLDGDIAAATSSAAQKRLQKEKDKLEKQLLELRAFDEKLRHYADRRITLDLDDGVKVNYGKFGTLLDQAKAIHGKAPEGP